MNSNVILITGGTGFAGSHLIEALLESGQTQIHTTTASDRPGFVHQLLPAENIHLVDLTDRAATFALIEKIQPNQIYHLAALSTVGSSYDQAEATITNNLRLQLHLLEAVKELAPTCRVLVVGSAQEYDLSPQIIKERGSEEVDENWPLGPANPYGVSKVAQDLMGLSYHYAYGLDVVRVRPFNHIGERQALGFAVSDFASQIVKVERGEQASIKVGNLTAVRDLTDVKDMVRAYLLVMQKAKSGEVFNIGSTQGYSLEQILAWLIESARVEIKVEVDESKFRPLDVKQIIADNSKICALGWQNEIPIKETLTRVLKFWRENL